MSQFAILFTSAWKGLERAQPHICTLDRTTLDEWHSPWIAAAVPGRPASAAHCAPNAATPASCSTAWQKRSYWMVGCGAEEGRALPVPPPWPLGPVWGTPRNWALSSVKAASDRVTPPATRMARNSAVASCSASTARQDAQTHMCKHLLHQPSLPTHVSTVHERQMQHTASEKTGRSYKTVRSTRPARGEGCSPAHDVHKRHPPGWCPGHRRP